LRRRRSKTNLGWSEETCRSDSGVLNLVSATEHCVPEIDMVSHPGSSKMTMIANIVLEFVP
ncbi:MAG: hypothetical protein WAM44_04590, partial [Chthoniobacterales bacterium]